MVPGRWLVGAATGNSRFFMRNTHYVFASLKGWGWITLIVGILEVTASLYRTPLHRRRTPRTSRWRDSSGGAGA